MSEVIIVANFLLLIAALILVALGVASYARAVGLGGIRVLFRGRADLPPEIGSHLRKAELCWFGATFVLLSSASLLRTVS